MWGLVGSLSEVYFSPSLVESGILLGWVLRKLKESEMLISLLPPCLVLSTLAESGILLGSVLKACAFAGAFSWSLYLRIQSSDTVTCANSHLTPHLRLLSSDALHAPTLIERTYLHLLSSDAFIWACFHLAPKNNSRVPSTAFTWGSSNNIGRNDWFNRYFAWSQTQIIKQDIVIEIVSYMIFLPSTAHWSLRKHFWVPEKSVSTS